MFGQAHTQYWILQLPGHIWVLQLSFKELDPGQLFPPQEGAGLLQLLDRDLVPVPHDLLQVDQPAQELQLPLTGNIYSE